MVAGNASISAPKATRNTDGMARMEVRSEYIKMHYDIAACGTRIDRSYQPSCTNTAGAR